MKYSELKAENEKLKRELQLANMIIQNAQEELDNLGAPNAELGAHPGHRIFWYRQELDKRKAKIDKELLAEFSDLAQTPKQAPETYAHKLPVVKDNL